jgi:maltose/moltooligosaccharide transporter
LIWIFKGGLDKELYVLGGGITAFGIFQLITASLGNSGHTRNGFYEIIHDLFHMPRVMSQLAIVQFFSWFAMFAMWIYGNGILFASYNLFAALAAIAIPFVANRLGCRVGHLINLALGGIGLISFYFIGNPKLLLLSMVGVGFAWASILSLPYALLSNNLPAHKMGVYMGIFNFFIVIPQLVAASILGLLLREFFDLQPIYGLVIGGTSLLIAGAVTMLVDKSAEPAG